jgi:hypothetical protein
MKDLFFVHDCNATMVNGLVNFDKLRLLASIIRFMDAFRYVRYDQLNDVRRPHAALSVQRSPRTTLTLWVGRARPGWRPC